MVTPAAGRAGRQASRGNSLSALSRSTPRSSSAVKPAKPVRLSEAASPGETRVRLYAGNVAEVLLNGLSLSG
ncbi:hypothetical protein ABIA33_006043 [Streptacidiphilus sp. MAP12-16]